MAEVGPPIADKLRNNMDTTESTNTNIFKIKFSHWITYNFNSDDSENQV